MHIFCHCFIVQYQTIFSSNYFKSTCQDFAEYFPFLSSGLGASMPTFVGLSVRRSLEKVSKIVKNQEFALEQKTKVNEYVE